MTHPEPPPSLRHPLLLQPTVLPMLPQHYLHLHPPLLSSFVLPLPYAALLWLSAPMLPLYHQFRQRIPPSPVVLLQQYLPLKAMDYHHCSEQCPHHAEAPLAHYLKQNRCHCQSQQSQPQPLHPKDGQWYPSPCQTLMKRSTLLCPLSAQQH